MTTGELPEGTAEDQRLRIGRDDWVAESEARTVERTGFGGVVYRIQTALPSRVWALLIIALLALYPFVTDTSPILNLLGISNNAFILRIGTRFLAFATLAIGLNVVAGFAGLLDLGYIAFFGVAGYAYAYLSSDFVQFIEGGVHLPAIISLPLIIVFTAGVGWLIGVASIRLQGDYLAIVTLGFGQVFVLLLTTLTRVDFFFLDNSVDLTRGPNGINKLDDISFPGISSLPTFTFRSTLQYYFLFLGMLVVVYIAVTRINHSRIGRGWRALHEDELAAEVMGMPTRRLKLMAFALGAVIAALAGTVFAAWQSNVVPTRYNVLQLIDLYAMVVLGGLGSLPGVVVGAFVFIWLEELLRNVVLAGFLFYFGAVFGMVRVLKLSRQLVVVLAGTIAGGFVFKLFINLVAPSLDAGVAPEAGSFVNQIAQFWLVIPERIELYGNIAIGIALLTLLATLLINSEWRWVMLGIAMYFFALAWETRFASEPAITRLLIVGSTLVVLMVTRPQGLFGKLRVEIV